MNVTNTAADLAAALEPARARLRELAAAHPADAHLRDAAALLKVLQALVNPQEEGLLFAFGAPVEWGEETPIGKALAAHYEELGMLDGIDADEDLPGDFEDFNEGEDPDDEDWPSEGHIGEDY